MKEALLTRAPCCGPYAAAEPAALALRAQAERRCWFPWRLSAFQDKRKGSREGWRQRSQSTLHALSPVVMSSFEPSCPSGKAKQAVGLLLPTAVLDLPECTFSAAVVPWSGLCSVLLFLVSMRLTKKHSIYILTLGINFITIPVSSKRHLGTSSRLQWGHHLNTNKGLYKGAHFLCVTDPSLIHELLLKWRDFLN